MEFGARSSEEVRKDDGNLAPASHVPQVTSKVPPTLGLRGEFRINPSAAAEGGSNHAEACGNPSLGTGSRGGDGHWPYRIGLRWIGLREFGLRGQDHRCDHQGIRSTEGWWNGQVRP